MNTEQKDFFLQILALHQIALTDLVGNSRSHISWSLERQKEPGKHKRYIMIDISQPQKVVDDLNATEDGESS